MFLHHFCGVTAEETCRYELLRVEHNFRYVDESIHPKLICCGLLAFHTDLSLGNLITLVLLSFDISHFLEYLFLWLGCRYEISTMSFYFTSVIFLALILVESCVSSLEVLRFCSVSFPTCFLTACYHFKTC